MHTRCWPSIFLPGALTGIVGSSRSCREDQEKSPETVTAKTCNKGKIKSRIYRCRYLISIKNTLHKV